MFSISSSFNWCQRDVLIVASFSLIVELQFLTAIRDDSAKQWITRVAASQHKRNTIKWEASSSVQGIEDEDKWVKIYCKCGDKTQKRWKIERGAKRRKLCGREDVNERCSSVVSCYVCCWFLFLFVVLFSDQTRNRSSNSVLREMLIWPQCERKPTNRLNNIHMKKKEEKEAKKRMNAEKTATMSKNDSTCRWFGSNRTWMCWRELLCCVVWSCWPIHDIAYECCDEDWVE